MSLRLADYQFHLPQELIARHPTARRDGARMMVLRRAEGRIEHRRFAEFEEFLRPGDLCVFNNARVRPARVVTDEPRVELLVLEQPTPARWICWVKPGRRARVGRELRLAGIFGRVAEVRDETGERMIEWDEPPDLEKVGQMPIPPYLGRAPEESDRERYQTVYARGDTASAVAAPTAGLHFTPVMMARLPRAFVTLDVGPGTFQPVKSDDITAHAMHSERFEIPTETADAEHRARRVVAVGTTAARVLEGGPRDDAGRLVPGPGETRIFLHPPRRVNHVGALLTNFHLPGSTLLMLVSALAGREFILAAYHEAVRERYRFFSYGDCMLII